MRRENQRGKHFPKRKLHKKVDLQEWLTWKEKMTSKKKRKED